LNFTVIFNSRKRVKLLDNCLTKLATLANDLSNIEVKVWIDNDDKDSIDFSKSTPHLKFAEFFVRPRNIRLVQNINFLAKQGTGRWVFILNDDAEVVTSYWDKVLLDTAETFKSANSIKDDILFLKTSDTSCDKPAGQDYSSFAIVSRQSINLLGMFTYEDFVGLGGDCTLFRIYQNLKPNRIVDVSSVVINHIYHDTIKKVTSPDETAREMRVNTAKYYVNPFFFDTTKETKKLQAFIDNQ